MNKSDRNCPDELILAVRDGEPDAFSSLCEMYTPMLMSAIGKLGLKTEDCFSEACLALYKSALTYELGQTDVTFGLYAAICVRRRLLDLIRRESAADRGLTSSCDMDTIAVPDGIIAPLIRREERETLRSEARRLLSDYEYRVFELWLLGESVSRTADAVGTGVKSVENARARILKKLRDGMRYAED
ncbi:MAG: hypothetical protein IJW48_03090 [Clostridia bacterium]|nr:hypothetical protein [Clostridia bacterium]